MKSFYVIYNPDKDDGSLVLFRLVNYISSLKLAVGVMDCYSFVGMDGDMVTHTLMGYECILVLGGDGTLLNVATAVSHVDIPLYGINLGTVGFLTEGEMGSWQTIVDRLISGDFTMEERMMIKGSVIRECSKAVIKEKEKAYFGDEAEFRKRALNDIVVSRAGFSRLIGLDVYVNGGFLNSYEGDGLIVSTPTGSTGYNLSAGGPIVDPLARLMIITPVCPHSLTSKSIVLPVDAQISIVIAKKRKTQETEAIVSFDGGNDVELSAGDVINICVSTRDTKFIKASDVNFYEILRNKLGGK